MKIKELLKNAPILKQESDQNIFDYLYFIPTRRKHDSGYLMYEIYGSIINKNEEEIFYSLSKCSDVIDFEKITCKFNWFCSIDSPEYNVFRLFTRHGYKFKIPYFRCSSFMIEIVKE